ncbi:molecular chaperone [Providencia burhodogranariea]|uniref:Pili assembly chaperone n=1 Tax=Providencia burhodogranariea DSM 19968 TaxID=1141662 RepID=K8XAU1_9GAMM|nr:molecular chaperone [Providencia burhodogranariea]EKT65560.1 pili assembly chaperone [Providencia burhodogranariea DSM 19968]
MKLTYFYLLLFIPFLAFSGVIPEKSRIVFNGKNTIQSYVLVNTNKYPVAVQLWIDDGEFNKNPELTPSPFVITPVMSKMEPSKINEIKIIYSGNNFNLPTDRESLFWLNIFEVPPMNKNNPSENEVSLSMLTQIKVMYRPEGLEINDFDLIKEFDSLLFKLKKTKIEH